MGNEKATVADLDQNEKREGVIGEIHDELMCMLMTSKANQFEIVGVLDTLKARMNEMILNPEKYKMPEKV